MHLMLCLSALLTLVFVALTQHLMQSTMECENSAYSGLLPLQRGKAIYLYEKPSILVV